MYTETLVVKKLDETFMQIECEASTERELTDHFCFYVPGYKFMPAYRNRVWDGKIRLFNHRSKTLYCGLYSYLEEFCEEREYELVTETNIIPDYNEKELEKTLKECTLTVNKDDISPRAYQLEALRHALRSSKSLLLSPTASGKSLIIYLAVRHFLKYNKEKVLIIVPTTSLVEQMYHDFGDYSSKDTNFEIENDCHRVYAGKEKFNVEPRVIISTWQSVYRLPKEWFKEYGMVIGDEAHNFKAKSLTSIMEKCVNAEYRIGTTGTLDGTQTHQLVLEGLFGPVYKVTTSKDLMDSGDLAQMDINVILLKYKDEYCKVISKLKYQDELDFIVGYAPRNNFIANLALDQKGNTLILFNYVEKHGKPLHDLLKGKIAKKRKLFYVSGETHVDTREQIRSITEKENNAIIVASLGTFSTGINIKRLHNLIFASPSKSQIRVLQSIGRGLRVSGDGINTKVYDIADDLHWKAKKNYTLNHAAERIKLYSKEKFKWEIFEINI
jgi:superfamily II DNA or RNA helicase